MGTSQAEATRAAWADPEKRAARIAAMRAGHRRRLAHRAPKKPEPTIGPYHDLTLAIALTAAYQSGYRHSTGDRAMALVEQHRSAKAAEVERQVRAQRFEELQRERLLGSGA